MRECKTNHVMAHGQTLLHFSTAAVHAFPAQVDKPVGSAQNDVVEHFNKFSNHRIHSDMSTVNFSVPEDVKQSFNQTFKGRNKSAIIADLMQKAVERDLLRQKSEAAARRILRRRGSAPATTEARVRAAREAGRP